MPTSLVDAPAAGARRPPVPRPPEAYVENAGLLWHRNRASGTSAGGRGSMILAIVAALQGAQPAPAPQPPAERVPDHLVAGRRGAPGRRQLAARAMAFMGRGPIQVRIQAAGLAPGRYGRPHPCRRPLRPARLHHRRPALEPDRPQARQGQSAGHAQGRPAQPAGRRRRPRQLRIYDPRAAVSGAGPIRDRRRRRGRGDPRSARRLPHRPLRQYGARIACGVLGWCSARSARRPRGRARPWWPPARRSGGCRATGRAG